MRGNELKNYGTRDALILPDSRTICMFFCFETFAIAEETYMTVFNRDADVLGIIGDLSDGINAALMALAYGAIAVADSNVTFTSFLEEIFAEENRHQMYKIVVENLSRMFSDHTAQSDADSDSEMYFQWDGYYKLALSLGLSEAEFWAGTPRKLWLLTRDKEAEEKAASLTRMYV